MVPDYPSNSNKSKEERPKLDPVVSTPAEIRKKRESKVLKMMFDQDLIDIKQDLVEGYISPKIKDLTWTFIQAGVDTITNALKMMVFKSYKPTSTTIPPNRYTTSTYSNYGGYYSQPSYSTSKPTMTTEANYDEFVYLDYGQATAVLNEMKNQLERYKAVSVLDLYNLSGRTTSNYTLQYWGWKNLDFAEVQQIHTNEGVRFIISLPKAKPLE